MAKTKGYDKLNDLRALLEADDLHVPEDVTDSVDFLNHLHTSAKSKKVMIDKLLEGLEDEDEEDEEDEGDEDLADYKKAVVMSEGDNGMDGQSSDFKRLVAAMKRRGLNVSSCDLAKIERNSLFWDALFTAAQANATTDGGIDIDGEPPEETRMSLQICGHKISPAKRKPKQTATERGIKDFEDMLHPHRNHRY